MSIVVAVRVSEGLVMATDSASTLALQNPEGQTGVVKIYNHANKLLQLKDYPIGVAAWGSGNLGARTISSLIEEYANRQPTLGDLHDESGELSVVDHANGLMEYLKEAHDREYPTPQPGIGLGILVGGYTGNDFFPEEYVFNIPNQDFARLREPLANGSQDFGANWYGFTDAIVRLHHGRDDRLADVLAKHGMDTDTIPKVLEEISQQFQYSVPFAGMPLQDAVDYSIYVVGVVVGRYRFAIGPELCGGPIDVATITRQEGFVWIKKKQLAARPFGPQV